MSCDISATYLQEMGEDEEPRETPRIRSGAVSTFCGERRQGVELYDPGREEVKLQIPRGCGWAPNQRGGPGGVVWKCFLDTGQLEGMN